MDATNVVILGLLGVALVLLTVDAVRGLRSPPGQRPPVSFQRLFGPPRDVRGYLRYRLIPTLAVLLLVGTVFVVWSSLAPGNDHRARTAVIGALITLIVIGWIAALGWLTHKRITRDGVDKGPGSFK